MNILRIYKIRYDRGCVSRNYLSPTTSYTPLSQSYPRGQISGFVQRLKAHPAEKKDRPAEYKSTHILFDVKFIGSKKPPKISAIRLSTSFERRLISSNCRHLPRVVLRDMLEARSHSFARKVQSSRSIPFLSKDKKEEVC